MVKLSDLEREFREWQESRRQQQQARPRPSGSRHVRVNGREVTIIRRVKRPVA